MKQVATPQQITDKVKALVAIQKAKGYKPGWVYHQMQAAQEEAEAKGLSFYCYDELDSRALEVAKGEETLEALQEAWEGDYEMHLEMEKAYGG